MKDTFPPTRKPSIADFAFIIDAAARGCEAGYSCLICPEAPGEDALGEAIASEIRRRLTDGALSRTVHCLDEKLYGQMVNVALAQKNRLQMIDLRDGMYSCLRPDGVALVAHWVKDAFARIPYPPR